MRYKKLFILVLLLVFSFKVFAQDNCASDGYTVISLNGMFTDLDGAKTNAYALKRKLPPTYNNEKVTVDYIYNPTHLAGLGDLVDVVKQGFFDPKSDYDLVEMLKDASSKVNTQKLLLVGYSQGNFYANNFYDKVVNKLGGVPSESIGVYSVATPDSRVANNGKYLTSDTDNVIAAVVSRVKKIMSPNTHIALQKSDGYGHGFSDVYLKYRGDKIVSDIKSSLDKLKTNQIQNTQSLCIAPQKISVIHKVTGAVLGAADLVVNTGVKATSLALNTITGIAKSMGSTIATITQKSLAAVGLYDTSNTQSNADQGVQSNNVQAVVSNTNASSQTPTDFSNESIDSNDALLNTDISNDTENTNTSNVPITLIGNSGGGGGSSNSSSYSVSNVIIDTTPPIINLIGESSIIIPIDSTYVDAGATAIDNIDGEVLVEQTGTVDTSILGSYVITYTAADKAKNISTTNRTINVVSKEDAILSDKIAPVITLNGENLVTIPIGATYTDLGAVALDNIDGEVTVSSSGSVDASIIGTYTITYTATDTAKNTSTLSRTVNIVSAENYNLPDKIAPVITIVGENTVTIKIGTIYTDVGATALDNIDGTVTVVTTGIVNTSLLGTYFLTYTAIDKALNTATLTRTINVVNNEVAPFVPVVSTTSTISLPPYGIYAGDGLEPSRGRKNLTPFIFQIIYTDSNNNPPKNIKLHVKNTTTGISLPDISMTQVPLGTDILSDGNYTNGEVYTANSVYDQGDYSYYFTADDKDGNYTKIEESSDLRFTAIPSSFTYLPRYSFGLNNGDGKDWQVWAFNGSNVYDWTDTYVNNYLHEQFKIQAYSGGLWCSQCLQRGIFNHDPQKGFEGSDVTISSLEGNFQNRMNDVVYTVAIQWDSSGYSYTVYNNFSIDSTGRVDVAGMSNDLWVGWDGSFNNFNNFPYGIWQDAIHSSPMGRTGGSDMVLRPYPVYSLGSNTPLPPTPTPVLSSEKIIKSFNFEGLTSKVSGIINSNDHTIILTVPYDTEIKILVPTIVISEKSSVEPNNNLAQDFTNPVTYIVKAEDGTTSSYIATVIVSPNPNPIIINNDPPIIVSHTLNGVSGSISINPLINNLSIALNSNKNVNWMSIKIEKEDDPTLYKMYQSSVGCLDGTNICTKVWDGILSGGGLLQSGNYKIKAHIKDENGKEYNEYLSSIIIVNI